MKYRFTKEEIQDAVSKSWSIAQTCRNLGIVPIGGNYKTLKVKITKFGIDTSHFTGKAWNTGHRYKYFGVKRKLEDVLVENSDYTSSGSLKKRLLSEKLLVWKCNCCDLDQWCGKEITLELNHINGNNLDNRLENLELLCPNCHSQTPTFRGRHKKRSALSEKREVEYRKFKETLTDNADGNLEPSLSNKKGAETLHDTPKSTSKLKELTCKFCNITFLDKPNKKYCCRKCYTKDSKRNIPKVPDLIDAFKNHKSFLQVGKHFNVSDNTIKDWCEDYGILDMVKKKSSAQTE